MDPISVDVSTARNFDSGEDMEHNHSVQKDETQECMEYRGKPYTDLTLDDLRDAEFSTISGKGRLTNSTATSHWQRGLA